MGNASIKKIGHDSCEMQSQVFGFPIIITPTLISKSIKCEDNGSYVNQFRSNNPFLFEILQRLYDKPEKPGSASYLTSKAKI